MKKLLPHPKLPWLANSAAFAVVSLGTFVLFGILNGRPHDLMVGDRTDAPAAHRFAYSESPDLVVRR